MTTELEIDRTPAWRDSCLLLAVLAVVWVTVAALIAASNNPVLGDMLRSAELEYAKSNGRHLDDRRYFKGCDVRAIYEELPAMDCSKGGVYLLGNSVLGWGTNLGDYNDQVRRFVHNFAFRSTAHVDHKHFTEFLISRPDFLQAGPEKTLFILGAGFSCCGLHEPGVFPAVISSLGSYRYDRKNGISLTNQSPWELAYAHQRERIAGFLKAIWNLRRGPTEVAKLPARSRQHNVPLYNRVRQVYMEQDWKTQIRVQLGEMKATIDLLRKKQVPFEVVLLPLATWEDNLPYARNYAELLEELCRQENIQIRDVSRLVSDDEFSDGSHLNFAGAETLTKAILNLAVPFLEQTGAMPAEELAKQP